MAFKKLSLPTFNVPYALGANDSVLNLSHADKQLLTAELAIGDFTYVTLSQNGAEEVIKIGPVDYLNNVPILARGATHLALSAGFCASFGWTDEAIAEMYPEHGLGFIDGCGHKSDCPCDVMPKTLTIGKRYSMVLPFVGGPNLVTVYQGIPGMTATYNTNSVFLDGVPTTAGDYSLSITLTKGTRSILAVCPLSVVADTSGPCA
jgi:hypothetical protein